MNMPSSQGNPVHQIICEHPASSLREFIDALAKADFLLVEEYYINATTKEYRPAGDLIINPLMVGKIKAFKPKGGDR
jgi:hypothetical protein